MANALPWFCSQWPGRSIAIPRQIRKRWSSCICFLHSVGSCHGSPPVDSWTRYTDSPTDKLWSNGLALLLWRWRSRDREGRGSVPCFFRGQRRIRQLDSCPWRFLCQLVGSKGWLEQPLRWCTPSIDSCGIVRLADNRKWIKICVHDKRKILQKSVWFLNTFRGAKFQTFWRWVKAEVI